jgi:DNA integrity scanning protein DisA with diadenylate cyclase activity
MVPDYLANGMVITQEMQEALTEVGMTEQEIKLGAYELKEGLDKNASYVGGKENYDIIMDYHKVNMSDDQKRAFNHSIQDANNSEALMVGLQTMYERDSGNVDSTPVDRVRGNPAPATIQRYGNKAELLRDKKFADSRKASAADKAKYRARLAITPEDIWRN